MIKLPAILLFVFAVSVQAEERLTPIEHAKCSVFSKMANLDESISISHSKKALLVIPANEYYYAAGFAEGQVSTGAKLLKKTQKDFSLILYNLKCK